MILFFTFNDIFNIFVLKIETSRAQSVDMPILEIRNVNDGYMHVCLVYSFLDKKFKQKTMYIKNDNSKCTTLTIN